jgi:hypothetical protein
MITVGMFWIVGAHRKWFLIAGILAALVAPVAWFGRRNCAAFDLQHHCRIVVLVCENIAE